MKLNLETVKHAGNTWYKPVDSDGWRLLALFGARRRCFTRNMIEELIKWGLQTEPDNILQGVQDEQH